MLKKGAGLWVHTVAPFSGGPELLPHLVDGDGDYAIHIENRDTTLEVSQGVLDTVVNLSPCPHMPILEVFKDIDLPGSLWGAFLPAAPIRIIVEEVLSGAGLKDLIAGFGPGEFVMDFSHWGQEFIL